MEGGGMAEGEDGRGWHGGGGGWKGVAWRRGRMEGGGMAEGEDGRGWHGGGGGWKGRMEGR